MNFKGKLQKFRIPIGLSFGIIVLIFAHPTWSLMAIGVIVTTVGLIIRGWASGHILKSKNISTSGPYAYTRNPLYLGNFLMGVGLTISSGIWWLIIVFIVLFWGIYLPVMSVEAEELTDKFGDSYKEYAKEVSLFFPWFSKYNSSSKKFELDLYMRYREYRATLGILFAWIVLAIKSFFQISL